MATFALIPGAASGPWYWHLVEAALAARGHAAVAVDLPSEDDDATFASYADAVVDAVVDVEALALRPDETAAGAAAGAGLVVVAHSLGGFTGPLVGERRPVDLLVLVTAMVPAPGEPAGAWWANVGHAEAQRDQATRRGLDPDQELSEADTYYNGVPDDLAAALAEEGRGQSGTPMAAPFPLAAWPSVPTRYLVCTEDRFLPADLARRLVAERLPPTTEVADLAAGHLPMLSHPEELADQLVAWWDELYGP